MITVYYDGKCGQCSKEISFFKRRTPKQSIVWNDIAHDPDPLADTGLSQADALMFMHVRDADGVMQSQVDAFIVLWRQFPGWSLLSRLVALPGVYHLTGVLYRAFAKIRFNRYPHCQASLDQA